MRLLLIAAMTLVPLAAGGAAEPDISPPPQRKESLSEKLDKGQGVIRPPSEVDPGMARPAPEIPNATPVIPPRAPGAK